MSENAKMVDVCHKCGDILGACDSCEETTYCKNCGWHCDPEEDEVHSIPAEGVELNKLLREENLSKSNDD